MQHSINHPLSWLWIKTRCLKNQWIQTRSSVLQLAMSLSVMSCASRKGRWVGSTRGQNCHSLQLCTEVSSVWRTYKNSNYGWHEYLHQLLQQPLYSCCKHHLNRTDHSHKQRSLYKSSSTIVTTTVYASPLSSSLCMPGLSHSFSRNNYIAFKTIAKHLSHFFFT